MQRDTILVGRGHSMTNVAREAWEEKLASVPQYFKGKLSFMTAEHHLVRYFVVRELPVAGQPISAESIAGQVHLPVDRVSEILDDLERNLTFLFRNSHGEVSWAYPVTVDPTPHELIFSTGERLFAA